MAVRARTIKVIEDAGASEPAPISAVPPAAPAEAVEAELVALPVRVAGRPVWHTRRGLRMIRNPIDHVRAHRLPPLQSGAPSQADGYYLRSVPVSLIGELRARLPGWPVVVRQTYPRHYIEMAGLSFDDWWQGFSSKTRSTLSRKAKKLAGQAEGGFVVRAYRSADDIRDFMALVAPLCARTYQQRLMQAGLPVDARGVEEAVALARQDRLRAFLLWMGDRPVAYLYLPVEGDVLIYAHLGYDPDHAALSVGTVLQVEAMKALFAEGRFACFDFTEGDGAHKALFGRGAEQCADVLAMRPLWRNRATLAVILTLDGLAGGAKALLARMGLASRIITRMRRRQI